MTPNADPEDEELLRWRKRYRELDKEARDRTEVYLKELDAFGEKWRAAGNLGKDPRRAPEVVELEKLRTEIADLWYEVDKVGHLIHQRAPAPSWARAAFDPHRSMIGELPPRPEFQAKRDERRRRTEAIDELGGELISHRLALAHLEKEEAGAMEAHGRVEKHREIVSEAIKSLEAEINRLSEIDSPGPGESMWLMENWKEILRAAEQEYIDVLTKERDLILERVKAVDDARPGD
jgi:hypothetical protein